MEARLPAFERCIRNESTTRLPCHSVCRHQRRGRDARFRDRRRGADRSPANPDWSSFRRRRASRSAARARARTGPATCSAASSPAPSALEQLQCWRVLGQPGQPIQQHWRWGPPHQSGGKAVPGQWEIHSVQLTTKPPPAFVWSLQDWLLACSAFSYLRCMYARETL